MILLGAIAAFAAALDTDFEEGRVGGETRGLPGPALPLPANPHAGATTTAYAMDDAAVTAAAGWLKVDPDFVRKARDAVALLYARRYDQAHADFWRMDPTWPTLALGPVGDVLLYQARMFENLDYRHDTAYRSAFATAKSRLTAGLEEPGYEVPEWFLYAGILGIDGIYAMRKGEFPTALARAYAAVNAVAEARKLAPDFVDLEAGDGLYLYWRTVVSHLSSVLPRFEDKRMDGIRKLQEVEAQGVILGPAATLALTYSYMEEKRLDTALASCAYASRAYPDNVINLMTTGRVLTAMGRLEEARSTYQRVLKVDPSNQRVWYHLGVVEAVGGNLVAAEAHWLHYIAFSEVAPWYRAQAMNRLGMVAERRGDLTTARSRWQMAVDLAKNAEAKASLARTEP